MSSTAVTRFETAFADWLGVEHSFAFWKGRVAMYAILKALGLGEGDEVILPGYTCVMDVNPIIYLGAKPVYVDIEPVTYNIDVGLLDSKITARTKVIVAQHTYGYPCDMDAIMHIAGARGVAVIEDCCLAMGSTYKGKTCGTFGVAAYWSFQWNKPFTTGIGGMATTGDEQLAEMMRDLCRRELCAPARKATFMLAMQRGVYGLLVYPRTTALITSLFRWMTRKGLVVGSSSTAEFIPEMAGDFFMGMGPAQARAGVRRLKHVEANIAHRRRMQRLYDQLLQEAGWEVPELPEDIDPMLVRYPVRVADKQQAVGAAPGKFVEIGTWFECPLHPIETPMHLYDYEQGMCSVAEQACLEVVNLPTHTRVNDGTAHRGIELLKEIGPPDHCS